MRYILWIQYYLCIIFVLSLYFTGHRYQLELFIFITYFFHRRPSHKLCFSCRPFVINATFSTGLVVSSVSWLGQEFKSLIISIIDFRNFFCCLAWAVDLGVQITDKVRSLYIGSFCPALTSLSRYLEEAAFSISISSSVFILRWIFLRCIMDMVSSIVFLSRPSLRTCSENLDLSSVYLKSFL
jgi:hypothetical protein